MLSWRMGTDSASISDAVHVELVKTLHSSLVPFVLMGVSLTIASGVITWHTGDAVTGGLGVLGVSVTMLRMLGVLSFRRRMAGEQPLTKDEILRLRRPCAIATLSVSLVLGLLAARSLQLGDPTCSTLAFSFGFGFGASLIARLALLPQLAVAALCVLGLPAITVALMQQDLPHLGLALVMIIFIVTGFELLRLSYRSSIGQIHLKEQYERLSRMDPMTGVHNRSALASDLPALIADRSRPMVAIYAIDLDHFKAANDRFGHPVGDALLKQVASRLTSLLGSGGLVVRMGGDEFILVDTSLLSRDAARSLAQRIVDVVAAPYYIDGHDVVIGVSVGAALSEGQTSSADVLLSRADRALYQAKAARGGFVLADAQGREEAERPSSWHARASTDTLFLAASAA
ncbi:putative diguanylate cyclase (GGDEF) [Bradyrhizobium sp. ORS 285]|nr:putative diguanylate cyclase (GGDEF) [Bradyrhizobium sp. ORS 285]SMX59751.1 putative diguanylate cyclase (GGDEF) [Bradyrhizobium sp. ORS 285]